MIATRANGYVLLAALWMLAAFSSAALHFSLSARARRTEVNAMTDRMYGRQAIDGALRRILHLLIEADEPISDPWSTFHEREVEFRDAEEFDVKVLLLDAGSFLHLTATDAPALRRFLRALGADSALADTALVFIRAARTAPELFDVAGCAGAGWLGRSPRGLEATYAVRELLAAAAPLMLCSGSGRVSVRTAPAEVLWALPGMTQGAVVALLERRARGTLGGVLDIVNDLNGDERVRILAAVPALVGATTSLTTAIYVRAVATNAEGRAAAMMEAVIARTGTRPRVVWRRAS